MKYFVVPCVLLLFGVSGCAFSQAAGSEERMDRAFQVAEERNARALLLQGLGQLSNAEPPEALERLEKEYPDDALRTAAQWVQGRSKERAEMVVRVAELEKELTNCRTNLESQSVRIQELEKSLEELKRLTIETEMRSK